MLSSQLLRTIGDLVIKVAPDGTYVDYVGPRELLSISPDVFRGRHLSELLPREAGQAAEQCMRDVTHDGKVRTFECVLPVDYESDGHRHFQGVVARTDDGQLLLILRDVQAQRRAELHAQESESRFRAMADNSPAMLWLSGIDGECEFFNKSWLTFTGRTMEQEVGVGWAEGVYFEDFQYCMDTYLSAFTARQSFRMEYRLRNAKGEYRWLLDQGVPRYAPDGSFVGYIGSCVDITDGKLAEQSSEQHARELSASLAERDALLHKLERRTKELVRSNSELEQFVYAASHDLRAPLRAIAMLSEWIEADLAGSTNPDTVKQLTLLKKRVSRMTVLLDDLLKYSRAGRVVQAPHQIEVDRLLGEVIDLLTPPNGFAIERPTTNLTIEAPPTPLKQIFTNLLSNAIVHHDRSEGRIQVTVDDQGDFVEFSVIDDGPGILPKFHERVFQMFQTLQPRDRVEGSGIGLALVKKAVETAGGSVGLVSDGRGCRFHFTWPKRWDPVTPTIEPGPVSGDTVSGDIASREPAPLTPSTSRGGPGTPGDPRDRDHRSN